MSTNTKQYDFVIIGGGIGGYTAAVRAAQLGRTAAIVEKDQLGGTCLHKGCIPSKAYLKSAELYHAMKNSEEYGMQVEGLTFDFSKVIKRKQAIVDQLHQAVENLIRSHRIDIYFSRGRVMGPSIFSPQSGAVALETDEEEGMTLLPKYLIIASGSKPAVIPGLEPDGQYILNSDQAMQMEKLPKSMLIIGGGAIGIEWASLLNDFGVEVTIVEAMPQLAPNEDEQISRELRRLLEVRGVRVLTDARIQPDTMQIENHAVQIEAESKGERIALAADQVLVCVGRTPNTDQLGLENTDVEVENGRIQVNRYFQTAESHIYAVGDVIGGVQLAHAAAREGIAAVEHALGLPVAEMRAELISRCIYSRPEVASVGMTEKQAKERGYRAKTAVIPFRAIGKAWVSGETDGFVKVVADEASQDILGVHMIGEKVTEMISEATLAQILDATPWEVSQAVHPHPSLSEALFEAMAAASMMISKPDESAK